MAFESATWEQPIQGLRVIRRGSAQRLRVQIYGQRCSGTNALARLLQSNLGSNVLTDTYGFKHWFVPNQTLFHEDVLVLVIARNVFDWLRSLHRQPWHAHPDLKSLPFDQFIRSPWHSYWDDEFAGISSNHPLRGAELLHERDPASGRRFANPIAKRTAKLAHWSDLCGRAPNIALLSHDTLQDNASRLVASLADVAGYRRLSVFQPVWSYKGNGFRVYEPTHYPELDADDRRWIEEQIDASVEKRFGLPLTS